MSVLVDTNILIYHTKGSAIATDFIGQLLTQDNLQVSVITKIEFLGWKKHTSEGFEKCQQLIEKAQVYPLDEVIAHKAIELRRKSNIGLADAVIAATAIINNLRLATRNVNDFRTVEGLEFVNPFTIDP